MRGQKIRVRSDYGGDDRFEGLHEILCLLEAAGRTQREVDCILFGAAENSISTTIFAPNLEHKMDD